LEYADKPDYGMLAGLFERCMKRRGVKPNDPYDWERPLIANEGLSTTRSLPTVAVPPPLTTATTLNQPPTTNVDTNNQENVEPDNRKELDVRNTKISYKYKYFDFMYLKSCFKIYFLRSVIFLIFQKPYLFFFIVHICLT